VTVRVLELFHPRQATLAAAPGGRALVQTSAGTSVLEGGRSASIALGDGPVLVEQGPVRVRLGDQIERTYPGRVAIEQDGEELRLVATMPLEAAVAAIVAAEAGADAPVEAMHAQAIASRSFLVASRGRHVGYEFCDTTHCQHLTEANAASRAAAEVTAGSMLRYRGVVVEALSTRRCGGTTRTLTQVGMQSDGYPYFAVACEPCRRKPSTWRRRWPAADLAALIAAPGEERARLDVVRRLGWSAVPSNSYSLEIRGDRAALAGQGEGHGVGFCQFGAAELARQGWDAGRILKKYFVNATIGN
jgi:stage II sporulation protein D